MRSPVDNEGRFDAPLVMLGRGVELAESLEHLFARALVEGVITHSERIEGLPATGEAEDLLPCGLEVVRSVRTLYHHQLLARGPSSLVMVSRTTDGAVAWAGGTTADDVTALAAALREKATDGTGDGSLLVTTHTGAAGWAQPRRRYIDGLSWPAVAGNYPRPVAAALGELVAMGAPESSGLVLWHGPAGSGKTTAVLALMEAWKSWCEPHLVLDPEQMLTDVRYLTELVQGPRRRALDQPPWRLLVCEDVGSYVARGDGTVSHAMSRLLNLTDGIFGRGSRVVVLLTSNADAQGMHPALLRPGRCLASVAFRCFDRQEAGAWLGNDPGEGSFSLADLLARRGSLPQVIGAEPGPVERTGMYL